MNLNLPAPDVNSQSTVKLSEPEEKFYITVSRINDNTTMYVVVSPSYSKCLLTVPTCFHCVIILYIFYLGSSVEFLVMLGYVS